ncbi:hypothetical protein T05_15292 [Trichinella murrelli]|uniref:Uncharacterized protein n=1 Tax=Trichinella murrelli TaxID=144512 RepID=A0A0V0T2J6_9BILA|nr:hypothetical protein T05_2684 [Trichinella murrelli]KRX33166.1 hypothetical protein T05_15292 [Trichinella murrelli]
MSSRGTWYPGGFCAAELTENGLMGFVVQAGFVLHILRKYDINSSNNDSKEQPTTTTTTQTIRNNIEWHEQNGNN